MLLHPIKAVFDPPAEPEHVESVQEAANRISQEAEWFRQNGGTDGVVIAHGVPEE